MTLALVGIAALVLLVSGYTAVVLSADHGRAPAHRADRALVALAAGLGLSLAFVAVAALAIVDVWAYDAEGIRLALNRAESVQILADGVPRGAGASGWLALGLVVAWFVGIALLWVRDLRREHALRCVMRAPGTSPETSAFLERDAVREALARWGARVPASLSVVSVDSRVGPITWGFRRQSIGLPTASWVDGVLVHELAHVVRKDGMRTAALLGVARIAWFVPVVQLAVRRVRFLMELAVDEMVVRGGVDPLDYADTLLAHARGDARVSSRVSLAGVTDSTLGRRVARLVGGGAVRVAEPIGHRASALLILACAALIAGVPGPDPASGLDECAVGSERVTTWRHLDTDGSRAEFRWWTEDCRGTLAVQGPLLVTPGGQLILPAGSGALFRLEVNAEADRYVYELSGKSAGEPWARIHDLVVETQPALEDVLTFLFRETGWDGLAWTRELARAGGVDGLLLQSRLAHDPAVKAKLVSAAVEAVDLAPMVELLRASEPERRPSLLAEFAGRDRHAVTRREVLEAALALPRVRVE